MTTSVWLERERASRETTVAVTASYDLQIHSSKAMKQVETRTNNVPQIYSRSSPAPFRMRYAVELFAVFETKGG